MEGSSWIEEICTFWFRELTPRDWWGGSEELDAQVRERFGALHAALSTAVPEEAWTDARAALATVLVYDQLTRNVHRKTAAAFDQDPKALAVARHAVEVGLDQQLDVQERSFLYMPFMHSENLADQERAVALFGALGNDGSLRFAIEHRDLIARFGRFPHRNRVLGRESTAEERVHLETASGYGQ